MTSRARAVVNALIDLPFALPTIVAGLTLLTLYGPKSPFGINIAYSHDGHPRRDAVRDPALRRPLGPAGAAGAGWRHGGGGGLPGRHAPTIVRRIILPNLVPAILTGAALSFARAIGEFGAVVLISGNIPFKTEVASVNILTQLEGDDPAGSGGGVGGAHGRVARDAHGPRLRPTAADTATSRAHDQHRLALVDVPRPERHPVVSSAWRTRLAKYLVRSVALIYLLLLLALPGADGLLPDLRGRPGARAQGTGAAGLPARLLADPAHHGHRGPHQHHLRGHHGARDGASRVPGQGAPQRAHRPAVRALAHHHRPALILTWGKYGWFGPFLEGAGFQVIFALPGMVARHDLRLPAVRGARGDAGPARGRHRPGGGRVHAGRVQLADVLAGDAAIDPLGRRLRRHPDDGTLAGRVRGRDHRVRPDHRARPRRSPCTSRSASSRSTSWVPTPRRWCWH